MVETQQVCANDSSNEESPEPETFQSQKRRFKATNMAFDEMVEMVGILRREDYDGKHDLYTHPNLRKDEIMTRVVNTLEHKFGVRRSKEQLRKRWSNIKLREPDKYCKIKKVLQNREKRLRQQAPRDPRPHQPEWVVSPSPPNDEEEGEMEEVGDMGTPPGDVLVVEGEAAELFTNGSGQTLIAQIMAWNGEIDAMHNRLDNMQ
ncbi:uncharacterized protein [Aquarana catesbeiana]|uniref:uncharacterized protein n=1 Tax=Aquarana catesbeiana TaxID=8400 RepID=UPI003CC99C76